MYLLRYAIRNITRHRSRTILTTTAVALAVALVMLGQSMLAGMSHGIVGEFARQSGHVRIQHKDYEKESRFTPLMYNISGRTALQTQLEALPNVTSVQPRLQFRAMLQYTDESTIVPESEEADENELTDAQIFGEKRIEFSQGIAIDTMATKGESKLHDNLLAGSNWFSSPTANEIIVGKELSTRLGAKTGDSLELVSYHEGLADISVTIVGVFDSGNRFANRQCFVPLPVIESLLRLTDQATEILVYTDSHLKSQVIFDAIITAGIGSKYELKQWSEIGLSPMMNKIFDAFSSLLLFIILVVASVGLLNTMLMTVLERQREIGVLLALGLRRWGIVGVLVLESLVFGVLGCIIGGAFGSIACVYFARHGIDIGEEGVRNMMIPIDQTLNAVFTAETVIIGVSVGLAVSVFGALWPAIKASAVKPVEAMRKH